MNFITKTALPRRTFLRSVGATVALPLLDAMVPAATALAKTAANAGYGKTSQGIAGLQSQPKHRKLFDSRTGGYKDLERSKISSPHVAAYTAGLVRALLSEILSRLPDHASVINAVTDGVLSDAAVEEMQHSLSGPVADLFRTLRAMVDPNGCSDLTEMKHRAIGSLVPHPGAIHHHAVQRLGPDHQPWRRNSTRVNPSRRSGGNWSATSAWDRQPGYCSCMAACISPRRAKAR
jgi:hypothetical protein